MHGMAARIRYECVRRQQRFDIFEQNESLLATRNKARGRSIQNSRCAFYLRCQCRDTCFACGMLGPCQRTTCLFGPEAPHGDPSKHEFVGSPRRRREETWIEVSELKLRLIEAPDQEQSPNLKIARMRGIQTVTVLFERHSRCVERLRREAEVARGQRDLGLDTSSACYGFFRTEGPCSAPQQFLCSREFAELRHRDASKCERWRIVSQGDSLQCSERITRCERTCCSSD